MSGDMALHFEAHKVNPFIKLNQIIRCAECWEQTKNVGGNNNN